MEITILHDSNGILLDDRFVKEIGADTKNVFVEIKLVDNDYYIRKSNKLPPKSSLVYKNGLSYGFCNTTNIQEMLWRLDGEPMEDLKCKVIKTHNGYKICAQDS